MKVSLLKSGKIILLAGSPVFLFYQLANRRTRCQQNKHHTRQIHTVFVSDFTGIPHSSMPDLFGLIQNIAVRSAGYM
jgi:hypothetical protein